MAKVDACVPRGGNEFYYHLSGTEDDKFFPYKQISFFRLFGSFPRECAIGNYECRLHCRLLAVLVFPLS